jgi:hypothetical protein
MDKSSSTTAKPLSPEERVALAQRLFQEYYIQCFWHMKPDLVVTEANIPSIVSGLRHHGGRRGAIEAAQLLNDNRF